MRKVIGQGDNYKSNGHNTYDHADFIVSPNYPGNKKS